MLSTVNVSIKNRIIIVILLIIMIMSSSCLVLFKKVSYLDEQVSYLHNVNYLDLKSLYDIQYLLIQHVTLLNNDIKSSDFLTSESAGGDLTKRIMTMIKGQKEKLESRITLVEGSGHNTSHLHSLDGLMVSLLDGYKSFQDKHELLSDHVAKANINAAELLIKNDMIPQSEQLYNLINAIVKVLSDKSKQDVRAISDSTQIFMVVLGGIVISGILVGLFSYFIIRNLSNQLAGISSLMWKVADGDYGIQIPYTEQKDEIGKIANSLELLKKRAIEVKILKDAIEQENEEKEQARNTINRMINNFKQSAQTQMSTLSSSTEILSSAAEEMMDTAKTAGIDVDKVSLSTEQTAENIKIVAGASEKLNSSVADISSQVRKSNDIVHTAVGAVEKANNSAQSLDEASVKIGEIITLIQGIAEQINLLALNATIESARAGEAGKGFAVVASEVKSLAGQANKATEEIASQIDGMQLVSQEVIHSLTAINNSVNSIRDFSNNISSAVAEQNATTNEISNSMQQASTETENVTKNMKNVSVASSYVTSSANDLLNTSNELIRNSDEIKQNLETFIQSMSQFN